MATSYEFNLNFCVLPGIITNNLRYDNKCLDCDIVPLIGTNYLICVKCLKFTNFKSDRSDFSCDRCFFPLYFEERNEQLVSWCPNKDCGSWIGLPEPSEKFNEFSKKYSGTPITLCQCPNSAEVHYGVYFEQRKECMYSEKYNDILKKYECVMPDTFDFYYENDIIHQKQSGIKVDLSNVLTICCGQHIKVDKLGFSNFICEKCSRLAYFYFDSYIFAPIPITDKNRIAKWKRLIAYKEPTETMYHINCGGIVDKLNCSKCKILKMKCSCDFTYFYIDGKYAKCLQCFKPYEILSDKPICINCKKNLIWDDISESWVCNDCEITCNCGEILEKSILHGGRKRCHSCMVIRACFGCDKSELENCKCKFCKFCNRPLINKKCRHCITHFNCDKCGLERVGTKHACNVCNEPSHKSANRFIIKTRCSCNIDGFIYIFDKKMQRIIKKKVEGASRDYGFNCVLCPRWTPSSSLEFYCRTLKRWVHYKCACCNNRKIEIPMKIVLRWCLKCPCYCGASMNREPNSKGFYECENGHTNCGCKKHPSLVSMINGFIVCRGCNPYYKCKTCNSILDENKICANCDICSLHKVRKKCPYCNPICANCGSYKHNGECLKCI